jgi:PilZ domain-containing protein
MKSQSPHTIYLVDVESAYTPGRAGSSAVVEAVDGPDASSERRTHLRHACQLNSLCRPAGRHQTGHSWKGYIEDVSIEGLKLNLNRRFEPGTLLAVEVNVTKEELVHVYHSAISRFFLAKVVRVLRRRDRKWTLGCTLVKKFNDEDLDTLVDFNGFCHLHEEEENEEQIATDEQE